VVEGRGNAGGDPPPESVFADAAAFTADEIGR